MEGASDVRLPVEHDMVADDSQDVNQAVDDSNVSAQDDEETTCKICRLGAEGGTLYRPCKCAGSIGFVHDTCLLKWIEHSNTTKCEVCRHTYEITDVYGTYSQSLLAFAKSTLARLTSSFHTTIHAVHYLLLWGLFSMVMSELWNYMWEIESYPWVSPDSVLWYDLNHLRIIAVICKGTFIPLCLLSVATYVARLSIGIKTFLQHDVLMREAADPAVDPNPVPAPANVPANLAPAGDIPPEVAQVIPIEVPPHVPPVPGQAMVDVIFDEYGHIKDWFVNFTSRALQEALLGHAQDTWYIGIAKRAMWQLLLMFAAIIVLTFIIVLLIICPLLIGKLSVYLYTTISYYVNVDWIHLQLPSTSPILTHAFTLASSSLSEIASVAVLPFAPVVSVSAVVGHTIYTYGVLSNSKPHARQLVIIVRVITTYILQDVVLPAVTGSIFLCLCLNDSGSSVSKFVGHIFPNLGDIDGDTYITIHSYLMLILYIDLGTGVKFVWSQFMRALQSVTKKDLLQYILPYDRNELLRHSVADYTIRSILLKTIVIFLFDVAFIGLLLVLPTIATIALIREGLGSMNLIASSTLPRITYHEGTDVYITLVLAGMCVSIAPTKAVLVWCLKPIVSLVSRIFGIQSSILPDVNLAPPAAGLAGPEDQLAADPPPVEKTLILRIKLGLAAIMGCALFMLVVFMTSSIASVIGLVTIKICTPYTDHLPAFTIALGAYIGITTYRIAVVTLKIVRTYKAAAALVPDNVEAKKALRKHTLDSISSAYIIIVAICLLIPAILGALMKMTYRSTSMQLNAYPIGDELAHLSPMSVETIDGALAEYITGLLGMFMLRMLVYVPFNWLRTTRVIISMLNFDSLPLVGHNDLVSLVTYAVLFIITFIGMFMYRAAINLPLIGVELDAGLAFQLSATLSLIVFFLFAFICTCLYALKNAYMSISERAVIGRRIHDFKEGVVAVAGAPPPSVPAQ